LLNCFGKDFEGIDRTLSDNFGRSIMYGLSAATTLITVSAIGGLPFIGAAISWVFSIGMVKSSSQRANSGKKSATDANFAL
jgi:hypothetical protein